MATSRAGSARAAVDLTFEELYRGHRDDVFRAALRELGNVHDAEDVTQAAFVDAYRAVLRGTQPQSPRAWLLAIAENVRNRRFRTAQRRPQEQPLDADFPLAAELPYEQAQALAEALMALPPAQRRVFVLRELVGRSYEEIAGEVGSTVASVQMLLFRARRALREQLDPPAVARRRPGLALPVPGWLTSLYSRVEVAALSPRGAGAVGAAAVVVLGATVAVPQAPADRPPAPSVTERALSAAPTATSPSSAPAPAPARLLRARVRARARSPRLASAPGAATPVSRPAARSPRAPSQAPPTVAAPVAATAAAGLPSPAPPLVATTLPVAAPAPLPLPAPVETTAVVPELSVPSLPPAPSPPPVPSPPQLPSLPVAEVATGAAGAAGADAPPLPVPSLPLETLPPAP